MSGATHRSLLSRLLLLFYPSPLRGSDGDQILGWWSERWEERRRRSGAVLGGVLFIGEAFLDVLRTRWHAHIAEPDLWQLHVDSQDSRSRFPGRVTQQLDDLRLTARSLMRAPAFLVVSVLTLATGVAAVTMVFSLLNSVLLKPLPYPDAHRIVQVGYASQDLAEADDLGSLSALDFFDLSDRSTTLDSLAASRGAMFTFTGLGPMSEPEAVFGALVSPEFFPALGVMPRWGRTFSAAEDANRAAVVVLSYELWQRRWQGSLDVLDQTVTIDQEPFTVVGVMPPDFRPPEGIYQEGAELWAPLQRVDPELAANRHDGFLIAIGRMKKDVSLEAARTELALIGDQLSAEYPEVGERWFGASSLHLQTVGDFTRTINILLASVGLLLLIASVNVAGLLLARAVERRREFSVRRALGARRSHIVAQLLNESLVLGSAAGILGAGVAWAGVRAFRSAIPIEVPRIGELVVDQRVLLFAMVVSVAMAVLFGLIPALRVSNGRQARAGSSVAATVGRGVVGSRSDERTRASLVIAETALAVVLVTGAGLLISSYQRLQEVELGFTPDGVEVVALTSDETEPERLREFYRQVLDQVRAAPGVESAGIASITPLSRGRQMQGLSFEEIGAQTLHGENHVYSTHYQVATEGYLQTLGVPLRRGRGFEGRDRNGSARVALVNEKVAGELREAGVEPLGQRFSLGEHGVSDGSFEIVGVVGNIQQAKLTDDAMRRIYLHYDQVPRERMRVFARAASGISALPVLRERIWSVNADLPLVGYELNVLLDRALAAPRFYMQLIGALAAISLALALVGVYSTLSHGVERRRREVGLRMALGATERSVLRLILRRGVLLVGVGSAIGLITSSLVTHLLEAFLFGVTSTDPRTFAAVAALVLGAGVVASFVPARRAMRVTPAQALSED